MIQFGTQRDFNFIVYLRIWVSLCAIDVLNSTLDYQGVIYMRVGKL